MSFLLRRIRYANVGLTLVLVMVSCAWAIDSVQAAVTPGWECIPTTAGQAVVSGGTGSAPACGAGTTAVLAPTYVSSGVGGKPTVEFSAVNIQVVNGSGSEGTVNGKGNLVVGYDEKPGTQTGSHDLLIGGSGSYSSYGGIVGGTSNSISSPYASVLGGASNTASGNSSVVAGGFANRAGTSYATVGGGCSNLAGTGSLAVNANCSNTSSYPHGFPAILGGSGNQADGPDSTVIGGDYNHASDPFSSVVAGCENVAGSGSTLSGSCSAGAQAVLGGFENTASGLESTVSGGEVSNASGGAASVAGGQFNSAGGGAAAVAGGNSNSASGSFASILGGFENSATTFEAAVAGGETNVAGNTASTILGGNGNATSANCQAIPAAPGSC